MKKYVTVLFLFFAGYTVYGQKLAPDEFHCQRSSLKNSFSKFDTAKKGRVAFLGGSITWGKGWRDSVCNYLKTRFPETEFDFINAGVPSMGSIPGTFRFERDVLKNGPIDLLFEEAAINDDTNETAAEDIIRGMEGIIRHALLANPACDIVIMHFVDPGKIDDYRNGKTPEVIRLHEKVAEHYNISTINLAKEVTKRIEAHEFDWENDFRNLHPSPFGQGVYSQSIIHFMAKEWYSGGKFIENHIIPNPMDKYSYFKGSLVEPNPLKPIKGWEMVDLWNPLDSAATRDNFVNVPMLSGTYPGEIIKFHFKGNAVGIAVAAGPDAGVIEYSIDNSPWQKQDLYTRWSKNLHLPWYYTLGSGLKGRNHVLQLRITNGRNSESKGNACRIRYFYVNAN